MHLLIADDHRIVRLGLKGIVEKNFSFTVIDEAATGTQVINQARDHHYDLYILDIQMPGSNDTALIDEIFKIRPGARIIIVSMMNEQIYGPRYLQKGVLAFLPKDSDESTVKTCIERALLGRRYITENISNAMFDTGISPDSNPFTKLTNRQIEMVTLMLKGMSNKEISRIMNIHFATVATHKRKVFLKLSIRSLIELVELAKASGFIIA